MNLCNLKKERVISRLKGYHPGPIFHIEVSYEDQSNIHPAIHAKCSRLKGIADLDPRPVTLNI
jgi:hypothetical protein